MTHPEIYISGLSWGHFIPHPLTPALAGRGNRVEEVIFGALRRKSPLHILLPFTESGKGLGDGEKRNKITLKIKIGVIRVSIFF